MVKIGFYLASLIFPVFLGFGIFNDAFDHKEKKGFEHLKGHYSNKLITQELEVIDREIGQMKLNVSFPDNHLRALLLLASHERSLSSNSNNSIQLNKEKLSIDDQLIWKDWVQQLELSSLDKNRETFDNYYWSEQLSIALNEKITAKDLYLTSLFVDEHRLH
ncbi:MAG TPA: hypothetical protein VJ917_01220 [Saprospiraceae bacterium]|nr:hypothetical protein [Saprospiraceae bacterium]